MSAPRKTLLIVYHTLTGGSRQMAEAAQRGAAGEDVVVRLVSARDAGAEDMLHADGYIFVTPENLAALAGVMKDFFDRSYYPVLDRVNGRPYAALVCAGSDGHNAVRQIDRICTGWRLKRVSEPLIVCTHAQTPEKILAPKTIAADDLRRCEEIGATVAAGLALGIF
jgi:multimeric flavodoxin WrbA